MMKKDEVITRTEGFVKSFTVLSETQGPDGAWETEIQAVVNKQGSEGDVSGPKPGFFDFVGTAKHEAWAKLAGTSQDDAMKKYVDLVKKLTA